MAHPDLTSSVYVARSGNCAVGNHKACTFAGCDCRCHEQYEESLDRLREDPHFRGWLTEHGYYDSYGTEAFLCDEGDGVRKDPADEVFDLYFEENIHVRIADGAASGSAGLHHGDDRDNWRPTDIA